MKFATSRRGESAMRFVALWMAWSIAVAISPLKAAAASDFLEVGGSKLFYEVAGTGPAMVFIHDGHMHSESWDAQWKFFSASHRVVRYDRRGYGKSTPANAPYSNIEDLRLLLAHLGVSNAVVMGCSAGGRLAIDFTLEHPALVQRLVLVGPVVSGLDFSEHFEGRVREGFRPLRERNDVGATVTNWMNDPWLIASTNMAAKERFREIMLAHPHNMTRTSEYSRSASRPAIGRLAEIRVPTLIVVGESDVPDVHAHCGAIQSGLSSAQRMVLPGAAHFVHLERPAEFNQVVTHFLGNSGRPKDLVYYDPEMERAIVRSNLVYKSADEISLEADLYLPPNTLSDSRLPAILLVLGEADPETLRHAKDWTFMQSYGRLATTRGFAGITFNHRSSEGFTKLREVRSDIDDLIRYVRANAESLRVDKNRICLWFFSGSGPHLEAGMGTNASYVRCIAAYYPLLSPFSRAAIPDELRREFSAIEQLKRHAAHVPPLLLAKAGRDEPSLNERIDRFREQAAASHVPLEFLEHPTGEHAFDIRNNDDTSREILRRTMSFIEHHLRAVTNGVSNKTEPVQ